MTPDQEPIESEQLLATQESSLGGNTEDEGKKAINSFFLLNRQSMRNILTKYMVINCYAVLCSAMA